MRARVELIYDSDCPNVARARRILADAMIELGLPALWTEWDRLDPAAPPYVSTRASPTILVNGRDVLDGEAAAAAACRVYSDSEGRLTGTPPRAAILDALRAAADGPRGPRKGEGG